MKKSILILLTAFGINTLVAQTNTATGMQVTQPGIDAPSIVTNKFNTNYPNTSANWTMDNDNYSAQYKDKTTNTGRNIVYDRNGNIIHSDIELEYNSYPPNITNYYKQNYPNEKYGVWSTEDNAGNITYYSKGKSTYWFDKDGKYTPNNKAVKSNDKSNPKKTTSK